MAGYKKGASGIDLTIQRKNNIMVSRDYDRIKETKDFYGEGKDIICESGSLNGNFYISVFGHRVSVCQCGFRHTVRRNRCEGTKLCTWCKCNRIRDLSSLLQDL